MHKNLCVAARGLFDKNFADISPLGLILRRRGLFDKNFAEILPLGLF